MEKPRFDRCLGSIKLKASVTAELRISVCGRDTIFTLAKMKEKGFGLDNLSEVQGFLASNRVTIDANFVFSTAAYV